MTVIRTQVDILEGLGALATLDPALEAVIAEAGPLPLRLSEPGFAGLAHIVVSQMVSKASADAIWRRLETALDTVTPEAYLGAGPEVIGGFGLSRAKAETLQRIAAAVAEGNLDLHALCRKPQELAIAELTAIRGIGPWTAEVYLMFCGGHADVFPAGDVALQAAVGHAFQMETRPQAKALVVLSQRWRPWRSVAARLFWAYYASRMRRDATPVP